MKVYVKNLQKKNPIKSQRIKNQIIRILKNENLSNIELSVVFVGDKKIKNLNKKFLSHSYPTDVLAFNLRDKCRGGNKSELFGEIIISADTAKTNAKIYKTSFMYEILLYAIHGILHLLGYNDKTEREIKKMRKKEKQLLQIIR